MSDWRRPLVSILEPRFNQGGIIRDGMDNGEAQGFEPTKHIDPRGGPVDDTLSTLMIAPDGTDCFSHEQGWPVAPVDQTLVVPRRRS